ncbi:MAG: sulfatase-like hydrolase/transferase [Verrucomicrobiales bacterium]|nr:sulfatase-like hydrolase/transferase [Verrucomicrobiales bacterium]
MSRILSCVLLPFVLAFPWFGNAAERPNIIVLFADDMGYSDIGCFGSEIETPNLDRLAGNGLRYTHFYNTGRCCPSRASILTGLYPHQADIGHMAGDIGVRGYRNRLSFEAVTLAEVLGSAGYHTLMTGKWHLGWRDEGSPTARGFQHFYGTLGFIDSYFTVVPLTEIYLGEKMLIPVTEKPVNHLRPNEEWYTTDVFTDYALHFIDGAREKDDEPFFLYLAYNAPHFPLHAKPEDIGKYRGKYREGWRKFREQRHRRLVELGVVDDSWALSQLDVPEWESLTETQRDDLDFKMALFAAIIDRLDQNVGRVIQHLEKIGELDNTLIVFVSDNGGTKETGLLGIKGDRNTVENYEDWARVGGWSSSYGQGWANLSNVPFRRYKRENHEGGTSAPFVIHWPNGIEAKGELRHQVSHLIDLMPTFVEVSGAEYPEEFNGKKIQPMEGRSLVSSFAKSTEEPRTLFWEHEGNRAIRDGDWKLVGRRDGPWELYDMAQDRTELNDLTEEKPEKFAALKSKWDTWAEKVNVLTPEEFDATRKAFQEKNRKRRPRAEARPLDPTPEFVMCETGELIFHDEFDPETVSDRWFYRGEFALQDGGLARTRIKEGESQRVFLKDARFHNAVIQFDFRFAGRAADLRLVTGSSGHYNSVVQIERGHFQINTPVDREADYFPAHLGECPALFESDTWHTMTIEYWDDEIVAYVDDDRVILGQHPIIDRTREYFAFQIDQAFAAVDNVRIWEAKGKKENWPETRAQLAATQEARVPIPREPIERHQVFHTILKSNLYLGDDHYRELVQKHRSLQQALHQDYPEAFRSHKELSKSVLETRKKLKTSNPKFKEMEMATHRARRAEDEHVVSQHAFLENLPPHRYRSELELARDRLRKKEDPELARLEKESADRQAELEAEFPEAFAPVDSLVEKRNAARKALNEDPDFKSRNREISDAWQAIGEYEKQIAPELETLQAAREAILKARKSVP